VDLAVGTRAVGSATVVDTVRGAFVFGKKKKKKRSDVTGGACGRGVYSFSLSFSLSRAPVAPPMIRRLTL
jgi:hypothetical protein